MFINGNFFFEIFANEAIDMPLKKSLIYVKIFCESGY